MTDILTTVRWIVSSQCMGVTNRPTKATPSRDERDSSLESFSPVFEHLFTSSREVAALSLWCHGAPGDVVLLSTVLSRADDLQTSHYVSSDFKLQIQGSLRRGARLRTRPPSERRWPMSRCSTPRLTGRILRTPHFEGSHLGYPATFNDRFVAEGAMNIPDNLWSLYEGFAGRRYDDLL
jgi:hypothetical protein